MAYTVEIRGLNSLINSFDRLGRNADKAMATTLNEAGRHAISESVKNVTKVYNFKQRDFKKNMKVTKATMANTRHIMELSTRSIPLALFGAKFRRKRKLGVSFKIMKGRARGVLPHAFMANTKRGVHVLMRKTDESYPLTTFAVISPTSAFIKTRSDYMYVNKFMYYFNKRYPLNLKRFAGS